LEDIKKITSVILKDDPNAYRYHPFDYLNVLAMRMSAGISSVVISRAGSAIFEIAAWGLPSIIIPLPREISHDQTPNAFAYSRTGAASIIEENNLTAHILIEEIDRIIDNPHISDTMRQKAKQFARLDSAKVIADTIMAIALEHEK
jgi:UDP-N-acetylglucosamine--N-acetylmuramyl-(pentapeptide) pyrophosphoryl-undecaprenol N-acetylglucosamine transferase